MDLTEFMHRFEKPYGAASDDCRRPPFTTLVKASKSTAIYNAHSYHTQAPLQGIEPYIVHYTNPGDLVLDPFCGLEMTGIDDPMKGRPC